MGYLVYHGVPPSEISEDIRRNGMTDRQARRLQRELIALRKQQIELQFTLARISGGLGAR